MAEEITATGTAKPASAPRPRRRRTLARLALAVLIVAAAVPVGIWAWGVWETRRVAQRLDLLRQAGEPVTLADLGGGATLPDDQNPAFQFNAASEAIDSRSEAWAAYQGLLVFRPPLFERERAILRAAVAENEVALSLAEHAASSVTDDGRVNWGVTLDSPAVAAEMLPPIRAQGTLFDLLLADGALALDEGDFQRALRRGAQLAAQARAFDHHPAQLAGLQALNMWVAGANLATEVARAMAASDAQPGPELRRQAREVVADLLDDRALHRSMVDALRKKRVLDLDMITAAAEGRLPRKRFDKKHAREITLAGWSRGWAMRNASAVLDEFEFLIRAASETTDEPTYEARLQPRPSYTESSRRFYGLARLAPSARPMPRQHYMVMTSRHMSAALLAVALYKAEHEGRLPQTLAELVPEYLPAVPMDPRAAGGKAIGYVPDPERPYVYNVGENGRDDGGRQPGKTALVSVNKEVSDEVLDLVPEPRKESEDEITWDESDDDPDSADGAEESE